MDDLSEIMLSIYIVYFYISKVHKQAKSNYFFYGYAYAHTCTQHPHICDKVAEKSQRMVNKYSSKEVTNKY